MYKAIHLSPMIPSFNIGQTSSFFKNVLDFSIMMITDNYVVLIKDNFTIHLLNAGNDIGEMEFYLEVDDVNKVWSLMEQKIGNIKARSPFNRDYGMREIHVEVPYTKALLFIGQAI